MIKYGEAVKLGETVINVVCEAVAAALDDGQGELDFTYAAKLVRKKK